MDDYTGAGWDRSTKNEFKSGGGKSFGGLRVRSVEAEVRRNRKAW